MPTLQLAPVHTKLLKTWTMLKASSVAVSLTGTLTETALATIPMAAAAMGPNGIVRITGIVTVTANTNAKTISLRLGGTGGTVLGQCGMNTAAQQSFRFLWTIANRNSQAIQVGTFANVNSFSALNSALLTGTVDTSAAQNIVIDGLLANAGDTITLEQYMAEIYYGA